VPAAGVPHNPRVTNQGGQREADVVVVGAGLSGLIAANDVLAAGLEPLVLEADSRVGGRILTEEVAPGITVELGAQWIGDTHTGMAALAAELGVDTFDQFEDGETTYELGGPSSPGVLREGEFRARHGADVDAVARVLAELDRMVAAVPDEPWRARDADTWDRTTIGAWYAAQGLSPVARELIEICTVGILAVPTCEVSLLDALVNLKVCGVGAELFAESEGGAQTRRFVQGTSEIPRRLAARLGDRIVLDAPVTQLDWTADQVTLTCRGGLVARGRRAVVAVSPTLAGRILYDPPLPGVRDQLTQRVPQASAHKSFLCYDEPFWRADGLNGQLISAPGPARMSNDSCPPDASAGIVLAFLEGESARVAGRWPAEQRQAALVDEMVRHFGPKAARPAWILEGSWADRQWTRGAYNANFGPCTWLHFGAALAVPIGPISWAATETADVWSGYMEGALDAGHRAAREVLAGLAG
jgi:monoamine oxidase